MQPRSHAQVNEIGGETRKQLVTFLAFVGCR